MTSTHAVLLSGLGLFNEHNLNRCFESILLSLCRWSCGWRLQVRWRKMEWADQGIMRMLGTWEWASPRLWPRNLLFEFFERSDDIIICIERQKTGGINVLYIPCFNETWWCVSNLWTGKPMPEPLWFLELATRPTENSKATHSCACVPRKQSKMISLTWMPSKSTLYVAITQAHKQLTLSAWKWMGMGNASQFHGPPKIAGSTPQLLFEWPWFHSTFI
jgi:hypothetical protein